MVVCLIIYEDLRRYMTRNNDLHSMCISTYLSSFTSCIDTLDPFTWPKWVRVEHVIASPDWSGDREISTSFHAFAFARGHIMCHMMVTAP